VSGDTEKDEKKRGVGKSTGKSPSLKGGKCGRVSEKEMESLTGEWSKKKTDSH